MALNTITNNIQTNPIRYSFLTVAALTAIVLGILGLMSVQPFHQMGNIGSISLIAASVVVYIALLACPNKNKVSEMQMREEKPIPEEPVEETEAPEARPQDIEKVLKWDFINRTLGLQFSADGTYLNNNGPYKFVDGDYIVYESRPGNKHIICLEGTLRVRPGDSSPQAKFRWTRNTATNKVVVIFKEPRQVRLPSS